MLDSLRKNKKGILIILISSVLVCAGQLFWKLSADGNVCFLIIGFFLYGLGAISMLVAYRYGSLSVLQPMLSFNYVLTIILAYFLLHEALTPLKLVGVFVITGSVILIGGGDN